MHATGRKSPFLASILGLLLLSLLGSLAALIPSTQAHRRPTIQFQRGDVFASVGSGIVRHFDHSGTLLEELDSVTASNEGDGMCFDSSGNLYMTNGFAANRMAKFDNFGVLLNNNWGSGFNQHPESCVADGANNIYVGQPDGTRQVLKFNAAGTPLGAWTVTTQSRGSDWLDLAADQCTLFYTSENTSVLRYNVCTSTQLPTFTSSLISPCYALRIRPNGEVMVACATQVYRLNSSGGTIQTYPITNYPGAGYFFAANLDPDGTSFWTGDYYTGHIYNIDIATGNLLHDFITPPHSELGGLSVFGEITVGGPSPTPTVPPTNTPSPVPPTNTRTATPLPPTNTRTATPLPPTATRTQPPSATPTGTVCAASSPTRVATPVFTPAPGCSSDPHGALRVTIIDHPNTTDAAFTNRSNTCSYRIGLAIYRKLDGNIDHQELYDYQLAVIPPHSSLTLTVNNPSCAYQADAFWGDLIESFANGDRYGVRRLDDTDGNGTNYCQPLCPPPPTPTATPGSIKPNPRVPPGVPPAAPPPNN